MPAKRVGLAGLIPTGFQTLTLANSTALGLNSTVRRSHVLDISVETNHARYRSDGTAPTLTTGVLMPKDYFYSLHGYNGTSLLKFQRSTGTCKVSIQGYRHEN